MPANDDDPTAPDDGRQPAAPDGDTQPAAPDHRQQPAAPDRQQPAAPYPRWWRAIVEGRSMLPTLADGDSVLVRSGGHRATAGRIGVVRLPDGTVAVKRLGHREDGGWWVERDNPDEGVDSWRVGAIPDHDVLGVVVARLWPRPGRL